jgi:hypothetical protein
VSELTKDREGAKNEREYWKNQNIYIYVYTDQNNKEKKYQKIIIMTSTDHRIQD